MTVFTTPDGKPFYGRTCFPPEPAQGMPSFSQVLLTIAEAWENQRSQLLQSSESILAFVEQQIAVQSPEQEPEPQTLAQAFRNLRRDFDEVHGGWGEAPKFPQPMVIEFLLRFHQSTGEQDALRMAAKALDGMARGGIYDQIGGGFHRYSVDEQRLVPHFEKMLYNNAQLPRVYLHA